MADISERSFELAIEAVLLAAASAQAYSPGGYLKRLPEDYNRSLCLISRDTVDFVLATQPKEWTRLKQHYGEAVKEQFTRRLAREIERRGALDVLRNGIKDSGCRFQLAYFRPSSGLNEETRRLYAGNLFSVVRQLRYSPRNDKSLDLVIFLNGIPIFTAELKNPLTGQTVEEAIRQFKTDRDPREPLLGHGRCLAHFAIDPDLVYVTTRLDGERTRFLPFNQGKLGGAGNPPVPPTGQGYPTSYLWRHIWSRDCVLELVRRFIHQVEEDGRRVLIFPRFQQFDAVRRLVAHAKENGAGQRYLVQHSAGSGKSFTIAWLAHQLATLHDADDRSWWTTSPPRFSGK
jgi:type I restriction enzyme R subunit